MINKKMSGIREWKELTEDFERQKNIRREELVNLFSSQKSKIKLFKKDDIVKINIDFSSIDVCNYPGNYVPFSSLVEVPLSLRELIKFKIIDIQKEYLVVINTMLPHYKIKIHHKFVEK